jgi:hypothetical protein
MGSKADTQRAAKLNPEMFAKFVAIEKTIDQTFVMPTKKQGRRFLETFTGVTADPAMVEKELARLEILHGELTVAAAA